MFAVCLFLIFGFMALAIDVGYTHVCRSEMQKAVDSAALAGASGLWRNDGTANTRARKYATKNLLSNTPVRNEEVSVTIGNWSGTARTFTAQSGTGGWSPNAIRVTGQRLDMPLFFGPVIQVPHMDVVKGATALVGGGVCAGIWGIQGITADGNIITDSYNSTAGAYGGNNRHPNGDICSNTDIIFNGGVQIRGDAMYGHNHRLTAYGTAYEVWGLIGPHKSRIPPPEIDWAAITIDNDNALIPNTYRNRDPFGGSQWDLYVTGNDNLTLPAGKYYLTSALLDGQAYITVTGPTELYVLGPALFTGGGIVNATTDPKNLIIYAAGSHVQLKGNSAFYGAVVAPDALIRLEGTSNVYGTLYGKTLDFDGNANIHVDEALVRHLYNTSSVAPILVQ